MENASKHRCCRKTAAHPQKTAFHRDMDVLYYGRRVRVLQCYPKVAVVKSPAEKEPFCVDYSLLLTIK